MSSSALVPADGRAVVRSGGDERVSRVEARKHAGHRRGARRARERETREGDGNDRVVTEHGGESLREGESVGIAG